eukprot:gene31852-17593_t
MHDGASTAVLLCGQVVRVIGDVAPFGGRWEWGAAEWGNSTAVSVAAGKKHFLVLLRDGRVVCFGDNTDRQCSGNPALLTATGVKSAALPGAASALRNRPASAVAAGAAFSGSAPPLCCAVCAPVAVLRDGGVAQWGRRSVSET